MSRRICRRRIRATTRPGGTSSSTVEDDDPLRRQINDVERALWRDDPTLMLHVRRLQRLDTASVLTVFALLATGSVLVTVGAATSTITAGGAGIIAMAAACLIDRRHKRTLRRPPRDAINPDRLGRPPAVRATPESETNDMRVPDRRRSGALNAKRHAVLRATGHGPSSR